MQPSSTKYPTHLECCSVPINQITQHLWIELSRNKSLAIYNECDWDMRAKEAEECCSSMALQGRHGDAVAS